MEIYMITKNDILTSKKLRKICKSENIKKLALFGSYLNDEQSEESDIDFIVEISGKRSLFKIIRISQEISDLFGKKVDLLTEDSISKYFKDDVIDNMEIVYEEE